LSSLIVAKTAESQMQSALQQFCISHTRVIMNRTLIYVFVVLFASVLAFGQNNQTQAATSTAVASVQSSTAAPAQSDNGPWFSQRHPRYEMRPSDVFDVTFEYTPEFNQTVTVQPDGYVAMRDVGDIYVSGKTVPEVIDAITTAYNKVLNHPMVSIVLKDFQKPYFIADGQVAHPGKYELRDDTTLVQAVAMAGGFLPSAKHSQVVLYHRVSDEWTSAKLIDVKKMESERNLAEDMHLQPGDMLFVPKNRLFKVLPFIPTANLSMIPRMSP
jgi:polysaccharide biosynthesis/export protein